jgi:hypothetical protein
VQSESTACAWLYVCKFILFASTYDKPCPIEHLAIGRNSDNSIWQSSIWQLRLWELGETVSGNWAEAAAGTAIGSWHVAIEHLAIERHIDDSIWKLRDNGASGSWAERRMAIEHLAIS